MARPSPGTPLHPVGGRRRGRTPVYFFVEGETEEDYVRHLGALTTEFQFFVQLRHTDRERLVDEAINLRRNEVRKAAERRQSDNGPRAWCLFDYDGDGRVDGLFRRAVKDGVRIGFSHPCLELWWLLHFQIVTGRPDSETIKKKLRGLSSTNAFHGLSKNKRLTRSRWEALEGRYVTARTNAEKLVSQCECPCSPPHHDDGCVPSKRNPSCDLAALVDSLKITY